MYLSLHITLLLSGGCRHLADATVLAASGTLLPKPNFDSFLASFLKTLIFFANFVGGLVIGIGVLRGLIIYLADLIRSRGGEFPKQAIRISLARSLALALELQLGADILSTALDPNERTIIILGVIIGLRTALNFFLGRELREAIKQQTNAANALGSAIPGGEAGHAPAAGE